MNKSLIECVSPSPVLNTPNFGRVFDRTSGKVLTDEKGHIRALEWIALEGELFYVQKQMSEFIFEVFHKDYPVLPIYIDIRFFRKGIKRKSVEKVIDPEKTIEKMLALQGSKYLWGGNWSSGTNEMIYLYLNSSTSSISDRDLWQLKGVDCSGLLYETTNGKTPRNTSQLIHFGVEIANQDHSLRYLQKNLKPLDMIIYPGHVIFLIDKNHCIESCESKGVVKTDLQEVIDLLKQKPSSLSFSIRRISFS